MKNQNEWYKSGWGVLIAIFFFPFFAIWYIWKKTNWNKALKWSLTVIISIIFLVAMFSESPDTTKDEPDNKQEVAQETTSPEPTQTEEIPDYEIIHETDQMRYDNAKNYFVLIDEVNLENDDFKDNIKLITKDIISKKGKDIGIDFFDNKEVLELVYKSHYGINSLGRILDEEERSLMARHDIAYYSGGLDTGSSKYEIAFFPATDRNHEKVGKYVEISEWDNDLIRD